MKYIIKGKKPKWAKAAIIRRLKEKWGSDYFKKLRRKAT